MKTKVTIFIPNYNGAKFIRETVISALRQEYDSFKVIVIDNNSTDNSLEVFSGIKDDRLFIKTHTETVSMSENWNRLSQYLDTPYFSILHSDDLLMQNYLKTIMPLIENVPYAALIHTRANVINEAGEFIKNEANEYKKRFFPSELNASFLRSGKEELRLLLMGNYIAACSVLYRSQVVKKVGFFDKNIKVAPDWEYMLRLAYEGFYFLGINIPLVNYRFITTGTNMRSVSKKSLYKNQEEMNIALTYISKFKATDDKKENLDVKMCYQHIANMLIWEASNDLLRGQRKFAFRKMIDGLKRIPNFSKSLLPYIFISLIIFGKLGGFLLTKTGQLVVHFKSNKSLFKLKGST